MNRQRQLSPFARDAIYCVKDAIDARPFERKSISTFANDTGVGRNLLQKYFTQFFGSQVQEYQKKKRMEAAAGLLEESRLSILKIASKCGYSSQNSFSRAFKEVYSITPTEWKKQYKFPATADTTLLTGTTNTTQRSDSKEA